MLIFAKPRIEWSFSYFTEYFKTSRALQIASYIRMCFSVSRLLLALTQPFPQKPPSTGRAGAGLNHLTSKAFPRWATVKARVLSHPSALKRKVLVTLKTRQKYTYVLATGNESYPRSGEVRDRGHLQPSCLGSSCFPPSIAEWCAYNLSWRLTGTICWGSQPFFPGKGIKVTPQKASLATMKTQICTCITAARSKHQSQGLRAD